MIIFLKKLVLNSVIKPIIYSYKPHSFLLSELCVLFSEIVVLRFANIKYLTYLR